MKKTVPNKRIVVSLMTMAMFALLTVAISYAEAASPSIRFSTSTSNGMTLDTDGDGTPNWKDTCPIKEGPSSNEGCPVYLPQFEDIVRLKFNVGKYYLFGIFLIPLWNYNLIFVVIVYQKFLLSFRNSIV